MLLFMKENLFIIRLYVDALFGLLFLYNLDRHKIILVYFWLLDCYMHLKVAVIPINQLYSLIQIPKYQL